MSNKTGGPASEKTLRDEFAGQALAGLVSDSKRGGTFEAFAQDAYTYASAMLAEKARRESTGKDCSQVPDHSPDAGKMVWKQSPNMHGAIICETQFSAMHADEENVTAYGGYLVAESVPEEAKALIIRAPQLEAANRELVEAFERVVKTIHNTADRKSKSALAVILREVQAVLAKHQASRDTGRKGGAS